MSYVRIVDIEISEEDVLYKLNDVLERRINAVLSSEHPIAATDIKILSVEDGLFGMTKYKVLILFG
jgi:hypothetical protein